MAIRCWAKYFAIIDSSLPTVTVPSQWVDFFTLMMLKQRAYDWAKDFLNSSAWPLLRQHFGNQNSFAFSLPSTRPSVVITDICYNSCETSLDGTLATFTEQAVPPSEALNVSSSDDQLIDPDVGHTTPPPPPTSCRTPP